MEFEWYEDKNRENICKHGLDFVDAWQIFDEPMLVEIDNREDYGEERFREEIGNRLGETASNDG